MHSEIVDTLRCLGAHEESWLVAAADVTEERQIMRGLLGCPVCHARYPIERGVADFTGGLARPVALIDDDPPFDDDDAVKLAAMLDLTDARGYVLLVGCWARLAHPLRELVPLMVLVANAPPDVPMGDGVSGLTVGSRIPLAAGSARGAALGAAGASLAESAIAAVRATGRVVGDASLALPAGVSLLARDDRQWVGTCEGGGPLLQLVRGGG